jgi:hypothetical protein
MDPSLQNIVLSASLAVSIITVIVAPFVIPKMILRLPAGYFVRRGRKEKNRALMIFRNIIGVILLIIGVALLFLPGQGILMIIASLIICEFPRKKKVLYALIKRLHLKNKLNHYRKKHQCQEFRWPNA